MRKLLYITPHFPPRAKVGALRPLKFVRHLKAQGWDPTVFCDYNPSSTLDYRLLEGVPEDIHIERTYGWWATQEKNARGTPSGRAARVRDPNALVPSEHLSDPVLDIPHAVFRGRQLMRQTRYDAILVNADPWAGLWVGHMLARQFRVPLVCDLRDPWTICELRRHLRSRLGRWASDRAERTVFETASKVILNNDTTCADYVRFYRDKGVSADRFTVIRNHADHALSRLQPFDASFDRFTAVFLGTFRQFVLGENLLQALTKLPQLGVPASAFQVALPTQAYKVCRKDADALGVLAYLHELPFIPNIQAGNVMDKADLLLSLSNASTQRIPAKIYEYLLTKRPILSVAPPHAELEMLLGDEPAAMHVDLQDIDGIARALARAYQLGRGQTVQHRPIDDSKLATEKLARVLNAVTDSR